MTLNQTQATGHEKYPIYVHCSSQSPKCFVRFALRSAVFEIFRNLGFQLTLMLKLQFFIFGQITKIAITLYSPMTAVFIIKFGSDRMKTGGVAF